MNVIITSGGFGLHTKNGVKLVLRGATAELPDEIARKLIAQGTAQAAAETVITADTDAEIPEAVSFTAETSAAAEGIECLSEDELLMKTNRELEQLICRIGLEVPKKANKTALVKVLTDFFGNEEAPPALGAEAPVV